MIVYDNNYSIVADEHIINLSTPISFPDYIAIQLHNKPNSA